MYLLESTASNGTSAVHKSPLNGAASKPTTADVQTSPTLLATFVGMHRELEAYRNGKPIKIDGRTLSIAAITAASRYLAKVELDSNPTTRDIVTRSREVVEEKLSNGVCIYGLSTGFGGSADTRTQEANLLGDALLQHLHVGILPTDTQPLDILPLQDPLHITMPESWVRGAMIVRMNSLIRGHSGVRWELIEKINELVAANVTPFVPLRGSISASGDLSPLSYIAGTISGHPSIRVFHGPTKPFGCRQLSSSVDAMRKHGIEPLPLLSKEHLGILNGTAFSASVASLALNDAVHLALLAQVCTAMGTEALLGTRGSYDPFIHKVARPHPGQVESADILYGLLEGSTFAQAHEEETSIEKDSHSLRQDRYPLRTSPQFLGPQIEDILSAYHTVTLECNSTTDNPLFDGETGKAHHGGNFQAMAVSNAMEKTRLALAHIGKLLFAQSTELLNPAMNKGLPPSLAASDPSLDYHGKGVDTATAAYASELGFLASPVTTHIQSAEMHNQAVNSLALISARATITALEVLTSLTASYLYLLCQALDIRALQAEFSDSLYDIVQQELAAVFGHAMSASQLTALARKIRCTVDATLEKTSTMDAEDRMKAVTAATTSIFVDFFNDLELASTAFTVSSIGQFRSNVESRGVELLGQLRRSFLLGERGVAPASPYLNKTRAVYEYVRVSLGVHMHGAENLHNFDGGLGASGEPTIGQNIAKIYEAIRDGKLQSVVVTLFG